MIGLRLNTTTIVFFILGLLFAVGCTPEGDSASPGSDGRKVDKPPTEFEKPDRAFNDRSLLGEVEDVDTDMFARGHAVAREGREHMAPDSNHQQFWLYDNEPFVLDLSYKHWGFSQNVDVFDIVVLANFEPIGFKTKRVTSEDDFPTLGEWKSESGELANTASLTIPDSTTVGVSLYIPPSSFPGEKAYDVRVLLLSRFPPSTETREVRNGGPVLQQSVTVYYQSVDFDTNKVAQLKETQLTSSSQNARLFASRGPYTTLLRPTNELYNLDGIENWLNDTKLGQVFAVEQNARLWGETFRSRFLREERSVVMAFDGTRPIEGGAGIIEPPPTPENVVNSEGEFMVRFPVSLELHDDEIHPIRFVKMAQPFTDMLGQYDRKTEVSNTIFVQTAD
jgi:hypothetical protein